MRSDRRHKLYDAAAQACVIFCVATHMNSWSCDFELRVFSDLTDKLRVYNVSSWCALPVLSDMLICLDSSGGIGSSGSDYALHAS